MPRRRPLLPQAGGGAAVVTPRCRMGGSPADERASAGRGSPVAGRLEWLGVHVVAVARRHEERVAIVK
jgi:hypothetical protein